MSKFIILMAVLLASVGAISYFGSRAEECEGGYYQKAIDFASQEPQVKAALNNAMEDDKLSVGEYNDLYDLYKRARTKRFLAESE